MGLLQPESGLLFWMCLAFGVVLFLLCKFGFPIILRSIEERKEYIDSSLEEAGKARQETMHLKEQGRQVMEEAQAQRWKILEDTRAEQEKVAGEMRQKAQQEAAAIIENARVEAQAQKEAILRQANEHIVTLAVAVAQKMLRQQLQDTKAQAELAGRILKEMDDKQN